MLKNTKRGRGISKLRHLDRLMRWPEQAEKCISLNPPLTLVRKFYKWVE